MQETLNSALCSTPIKLENRRKYAPLTPAGRDRPKLLAASNGFISVEPTFRKTLSQGSLVKGTTISLFGNEQKVPQNTQKMATDTQIPLNTLTTTEQDQKLTKNEAYNRSSPFKRDKEKIRRMQQQIGNYELFFISYTVA